MNEYHWYLLLSTLSNVALDKLAMFNQCSLHVCSCLVINFSVFLQYYFSNFGLLQNQYKFNLIVLSMLSIQIYYKSITNVFYSISCLQFTDLLYLKCTRYMVVSQCLYDVRDTIKSPSATETHITRRMWSGMSTLFFLMNPCTAVLQ